MVVAGAIASDRDQLRFTHPDLDSWIDVRLRDFDDRWLAVADLADKPGVGVRETAEEALQGALASLGERMARELVAVAFSRAADAPYLGRSDT